MTKSSQTLSWYRIEEHLFEWILLFAIFVTFCSLSVKYAPLFKANLNDLWFWSLVSYITIPFLWRFALEFEKITLEVQGDHLVMTRGILNKTRQTIALSDIQISLKHKVGKMYLGPHRQTYQIILTTPDDQKLTIHPNSNSKFTSHLLEQIKAMVDATSVGKSAA